VLTDLLKVPFISIGLSKQLQLEVGRLLKIPEEEIESDEDQRQDEEEEQTQPKVPGTQAIEERFDYTLREWLGFDFQEYKNGIQRFLTKHKFRLLIAKNNVDLQAGKLNAFQVDRLRFVLQRGFEEEQTIREIASEINKKVKPPDLFQVKDGEIRKNKDGSNRLVVSSELRAINMARTQITFVANQGALINYRDAGIEEVSWVASFGPRTCPICEALNGKIMNARNPEEVPPAHSMCRCTLIPVIK